MVIIFSKEKKSLYFLFLKYFYIVLLEYYAKDIEVFSFNSSFYLSFIKLKKHSETNNYKY